MLSGRQQSASRRSGGEIGDLTEVEVEGHVLIQVFNVQNSISSFKSRTLSKLKHSAF